MGGTGSVFLLLDEPEVYGLPPDPVVTTRDLPEMWRKAGLAALTMLAGAVLIAVLALLCDGLLLLVQRILTPAGLRARG